MASSRSVNRCLLAFFVCFFLLLSPIASAQDDIDVAESERRVSGDGGQDLDADLGPAPGVDTVVFFPRNPDKSFQAGEQIEILVGISNNGDAHLHVHSARASLHLPHDHKYLLQKYSVVEFGNVTVPKSIQASFPYKFTVNKYLQPGTYDLLASILYEVDSQKHESAFHNGTIEVVEASGFLSGETIFLLTLGLGMLGLLGIWVFDQFQKLSKKTRKIKKVENGTQSANILNNEWLQGTAFTQKLSRSIAQPTKSKKKK